MMTDPTADTPTARSPRWMRLLLVLSLAVNLLVIGLALGVALGRTGGETARPGRDAVSGFYLRALEPEQRADFIGQLRREGRGLRLDRATIRTELRATLELLRADSFDAEAFADRLSGQRARLAARADLGDRVFIGVLAGMSVEERRAYAERIEQSLRRPLREETDG